jgi:bacteriocin-like protein
MREFTEIPLSELTDKELDAVSGGLLNFSPLSPVTQANVATQVGVGIGIGGLVGAGIVGQSLRQANFNF